MTLICLRDKQEIEQYLRRNIQLHLYGIGDLDNFFWPYTTWYGWKTQNDLSAVAFLYEGQPPPTLLALSESHEAMADLLQAIRHFLPLQFYAHLSPGLERILRDTYHLAPHGMHNKMALNDPTKIGQFDGFGVVSLGMAELAELQAFYHESYPGNWFDPRMLETRQYFGIRAAGRLVSAGGVHVYSPQYGVAVVGNIATHPSYRGRGYGTAVTACVCRSLAQAVQDIGLNVKADNQPAIACYERLGFDIIASYGEFMAQRQ